MVMRQDASTGQVVDNDQATAASAETQGKGGKKPTMDIKVYAPFKVYYDGKGTSITAVNRTGPFDVLPRHHNFLCMLSPCNLVIRTLYDTKTVNIGRALMHVRGGKVTVFVDV